ncbi:aminoacyl-tRNA hydrolase [Corynebacterium sp.]|uniref:aminoacyl-tRNA hydrolase n=1 Tax=Corynebacterium sp. TaxID=1720 RepID=UPI003736A2DC
MTILIVGLGNPGPKYADTRHNIGVMVLEELLDEVSPMPAALSVHKKTNTEIAEVTAGRLFDEQTVLARTRSYMNESGGPVKALAGYFGVAPKDIYVLYDEIDLDFGQVKFRRGGGDHGHNGLKSVTKSLGTGDYNKLAVGISRPPGRQPVADYVLKPFNKKEAGELPFVCSDAVDELRRAL